MSAPASEHMRQRRRAATIVVVAALVAIPAGVVSARPHDVSDSIAQKRSELTAIQNRLDHKRQQLTFEELRKHDYERQLGITTAAIQLVDQRLGTLDRRIARAVDGEARARFELAHAQSDLDRQRRAADGRLVMMYERPADSVLAVIFASSSFVDLTERWHDLSLVAREDQREIVEREAAVRRVAAARAELAAAIEELEGERTAQAQEQSQLAALGRQRADLAAIAEEDRISVAREVRQLEDLTAHEEAQLEALTREQEEALAQEREAGRAPTPPTTRVGEMQWPLTGPITSPFGMRLNPFGGGKTEFHPGIDIAVAVGTTIAAAASGRVIIAGWVSGYGNYIAIDHGNGLSTGYGHLSQIYVSVGQDVERGQAIGASGNTGRSTGPHLIFEVRRNGSPIDPTPFLP